jgi:hypothetical protein
VCDVDMDSGLGSFCMNVVCIEYVCLRGWVFCPLMRECRIRELFRRFRLEDGVQQDGGQCVRDIALVPWDTPKQVPRNHTSQPTTTSCRT